MKPKLFAVFQNRFGVFALRCAAFGDLPRVVVQGVAVLADEHDAVVVVDSDDADGRVGEMDDPLDPGAAVGPGDLVVPDRDPGVLVGDTTSGSNETAVHRGIVAWRGRRRRRVTDAPRLPGVTATESRPASAEPAQSMIASFARSRTSCGRSS